MADAALYYGRIKKLVWLQINDAVLNLPGTLFSNDNATSNRAIINNNRFTALHSNSLQAEVLIKTNISVNYIIFPEIQLNYNPFFNDGDDDLPF